ncbi:MAG: CvpA family protein [Verrucomicrobia bacterium]|nr:CvpA family protein [Verrucomicrobiota bacterium]
MPSWLDFSNLFSGLAKLTFGWFDFLAVVLIMLGLHLGNKSGATKQALSLAQWFGTLIVAAVIHPMLGDMLAPMLGVRLWIARLIAYASLASLLLLVLALLRRRIADRFEESNLFGKLEYVIGPVAAAVRNVSVVLLVLAIVHGIEVNPDAEKKTIKGQMDDFGFMLYPTPGVLQEAFFKNSATGKWVGDNLGFLLVTPPGNLQTAGLQ